MNDKPSDLEALAPALVELEQMRLHYADDNFELLVPESLLAGVSKAWGYTVRHIPGIDCVYVARRAEIRTKPLL